MELDTEDEELCEVCKKVLPEGRKYVGYHKECAARSAKPKFVIAGFGSKGNGAHVTRFTHGER